MKVKDSQRQWQQWKMPQADPIGVWTAWAGGEGNFFAGLSRKRCLRFPGVLDPGKTYNPVFKYSTLSAAIFTFGLLGSSLFEFYNSETDHLLPSCFSQENNCCIEKQTVSWEPASGKQLKLRPQTGIHLQSQSVPAHWELSLLSDREGWVLHVKQL